MIHLLRSIFYLFLFINLICPFPLVGLQERGGAVSTVLDLLLGLVDSLRAHTHEHCKFATYQRAACCHELKAQLTFNLELIYLVVFLI